MMGGEEKMDENLNAFTFEELIETPVETTTEVESVIENAVEIAAVEDVGDEVEVGGLEEVELVEAEAIDEVEVEIEETIGWVGGSSKRHYSLVGRNEPNQHTIEAITGLRAELDDIEALKTVESNQYNVANYYKWADNKGDDTYGYFVSIVPDSMEIEVCKGVDIFGVSVDSAGFIGGQDATLRRDDAYGLIVTSGLVDVRCELEINVGDYVIANAYGYAKKSVANYGYKVLAKENKNGVEYALIALGVQADTINAFGRDLDGVKEQVDANYKNIVAAINVANQAYSKAEAAADTTSMSQSAIEDALQEIIGFGTTLDEMQQTVILSSVVSAQAKAVAESAATSAVSMKNEAVEKANEALADNTQLRQELETKVAEIDEALDNTELKLQEAKEGLQDTIRELQLDTEGQLAEFKKDVAKNYATTTQLAAVKTEAADAVAAFRQEASDTYATNESVAAFQTATSEAITGFKQEVSETYATQEMLTSLDTDTSQALAEYKQEVTDTYATQEMVSKFAQDATTALADYKQDVTDTYATQEMVSKFEKAATQALTDYQQEVAETYATQSSLTTLRTDTTNAIAASEEKATSTYASKSDFTSFESKTNLAMARIEQKADENGAYIQSTVSNMDKYSVGPHSQAYGFTRKQAQNILDENIIYVPTEDGVTETYVGEGELPTYTRTFSKTYLYRWGEVGDGYGWITVDANYSKDKLNVSAPSVFFSHTMAPAIAQSETYGYWYTDSDTLTGTAAEYEPHTLYKWDEYDTKDDEGKETTARCWVPVATLAGNVNTRAVSQIRQDANSITAEITNARGSAASLGARLTDTESEVQSLAAWTKDADGKQYNLATIQQKANDAGASIAQVVEAVGANGEVNVASIVTAINNDTSGIVLSADHINLKGKVTFESFDADTKKQIEADTISVEIWSSRGNIFKSGDTTTILTCHVFQAGVDITSTLPNSAFTWEKINNDGTKDEQWTATPYGNKANIIQITAGEIWSRAVFNCAVTI